MLVFDIETNGLLDTMTLLHCINIIDRSTGRASKYSVSHYADGTPAPRDGTIEEGLAILADADEIAGQNIRAFDIPAIQKVYPSWKPRGKIIDTLVRVRVIYPNVADRDFVALSNGSLPESFRKSGLIGSHSLEAWGFRLGVLKGTFDGPWEDYTQTMDEYATQDPVVTLRLLEKIESCNYSPECLQLEEDVQRIVVRQRTRGWAFDVARAEALVAKLQRRLAEIGAELQQVFPPWTVQLPDFMPKRDNKKRGYTAGVPVKREKEVVFNPGSRHHIADRLSAIHGWKPSKFTESGQAAIDEAVLASLHYPEAKLLSEYFIADKLLGQVATGDKAWLKFATKLGVDGRVSDGVVRVHGGVNTNGAVTGRMTHSNPNVAQTPTVEADFGVECRSCWTVSPGMVQIGCDADGLELRFLAHYMAAYDGGAYMRAVVNGRKEDGTDAHSINRDALGLNSRDVGAKRFIYALIYGAGDYKLGMIVYDDFTDETRARFLRVFTTPRKRAAALKNIGADRRARLMKNLPALAKLIEAVKRAVKKRGWLRGIDGRKLHIRSEHSALNTLLQSGGAVLMKKALVIFDASLAELRARYTVEIVGNIHDEWQMEAVQEIANEVGTKAAQSITLAGEHFKLLCPFKGNFKIGDCWAATH